jgi:hypothetical protein
VKEEKPKKPVAKKHDRGIEEDYEILELIQDLLNISNVYIAGSRLSAHYFRKREG